MRSAALGCAQLGEESWDILPGQRIGFAAAGKVCLDDYHPALWVAAGTQAVESRESVVVNTVVEVLRNRDRDPLEADSHLCQHQDPCHDCSCRCVESVMTLVSSVEFLEEEVQ